MMTSAEIKSRWAVFMQQERGRRIARWARRFFFAGILGMLLYQLAQVGWRDILESLPTTPWFYAIFVVLYFSLPMTEALVYRQLWRFRYWDGLVAFLKKRVLNKDVLGYSGDVYLYLWARKHIRLGEREIRGAVKDNAIISSVASTLFAVGVLVTLFFTGMMVWGEQLASHGVSYVAGAVVLGATIAALLVRFRKALFHLSGKTVAAWFAIHLSRLIIITSLQVVQWAIVMPEVGWQSWGTMIAVQIVTSRIPFLPARDLVFIGASVELSRILDMSASGVAGMLLASSVLDKVLNLVFFLLSTFLLKRRMGLEGSAVAAPAPAVQDVAKV